MEYLTNKLSHMFWQTCIRRPASGPLALSLSARITGCRRRSGTLRLRRGRLANHDMRASDFDRWRFLQLASAAGLIAAWPHQLNAGGDMIRRTIPKTGETLPVIGLGSLGAFDVEAASEDHRACLELLLNAGGGMIDASPMYGRAESVVGKLLAMQAN